jgi:hypothetical protein
MHGCATIFRTKVGFDGSYVMALVVVELSSASNICEVTCERNSELNWLRLQTWWTILALDASCGTLFRITLLFTFLNCIYA